jgi:hypothetical protein
MAKAGSRATTASGSPTRSVNSVISDLLSTRDQSAVLSAPVTDIVEAIPGIDGNFLATSRELDRTTSSPCRPSLR